MTKRLAESVFYILLQRSSVKRDGFMLSNGFVAKETVFYKWGSSPLDEINDVGFLKQVCTGTGIKARKFF
jgi:hypothetical protein